MKEILVTRWSCLGLKMPFLDLVTIGWDNYFGPGEHEDDLRAWSSWLDGGEDSLEFGNTWGGDEVYGDVGMDIAKDKFWDVVGKKEAMEMEFEFWDMDFGMICMWFKGVELDGCMHVRMNVGEGKEVVISAEE